MKKSLPGKKTAYAFGSLESPFPTAGTKEKSNTYPPLFGNPPDMSKVMWPGDFFGCAVPEGSGRKRMRTTSAVRENMERPVDKT